MDPVWTSPIHTYSFLSVLPLESIEQWVAMDQKEIKKYTCKSTDRWETKLNIKIQRFDHVKEGRQKKTKIFKNYSLQVLVSVKNYNLWDLWITSGFTSSGVGVLKEIQAFIFHLIPQALCVHYRTVDLQHKRMFIFQIQTFTVWSGKKASLNTSSPSLLNLGS